MIIDSTTVSAATQGRPAGLRYGTYGEIKGLDGLSPKENSVGAVYVRCVRIVRQFFIAYFLIIFQLALIVGESIYPFFH